MLLFNKKIKKAFTLLELIIYMSVIGVVLYPMPGILNMSVAQLRNEDATFKPYSLYNFIEDIKYDNVLSISSNFTNNSNGDANFTLKRIDGCDISYSFVNTSKEFSRTVSCSSTNLGIREYIIDKIEDVEIKINTLNNYEFTIKQSNDSNTYRYILYNKG